MPDNPFKIKKNSVRDGQMPGYNSRRTAGDNLLFMPNFSGWIGKSLKSKSISAFYALLVLLFCILFRSTICSSYISYPGFTIYTFKNLIPPCNTNELTPIVGPVGELVSCSCVWCFGHVESTSPSAEYLSSLTLPVSPKPGQLRILSQTSLIWWWGFTPQW